MNQVDLPIVDDELCQEHFEGYLPETELCAGYEMEGKDWCWVGCYTFHFNRTLAIS